MRPGFPQPEGGGAWDAQYLYQLALVTPGISPFSASWRKHRRQTPNLRKNARGRPQRQQRLRCRVGCIAIPGLFSALAVWDARRIFSSLISLAILAVVAIVSLSYPSLTASLTAGTASPSV